MIFKNDEKIIVASPNYFCSGDNHKFLIVKIYIPDLANIK